MTKLALTDIKPQEFTFRLSDYKEKEFTLKKFSLAEQIWCEQHFGQVRLKQIFNKQDIVGIAELAHHLLKDPSDFPTFMDFAGAIVTMDDKIAVVQGLLATIGISKPIIEKLAKDLTPPKPMPQPTPKSREKRIGAKSSTKSRANTSGRKSNS